jgi:hypothetical protein
MGATGWWIRSRKKTFRPRAAARAGKTQMSVTHQLLGDAELNP